MRPGQHADKLETTSARSLLERAGKLKSFILIAHHNPYALPQEFADCDARFSPILVERLTADFTKEGDIAFDPFAGFGTTLQVAERMARVGLGIEADEKRCLYARS